MDFQEYPKALYKAGVLRTVGSAAEEALSLHDGFDNWHADHAKVRGDVAADEKPEAPAAEARPKRAYTRRTAQADEAK